MDFSGKVAVVTGGASGIGRATAELFAESGARVVVADHSLTGTEVAAGIAARGGEALFVQTDVADSTSVAALVSTAVARFGGIDVLFNGAGVLAFGTAVSTDEATWRRVIDVNLTGTFLVSRAVVSEMIRRGGGAIVNASSSTGAHDGNANAVAYVASKGGVTLLTRCMAIDHAADNIRVNAVAPGPTDTPMLQANMTPEERAAFAATFPLRRLGRPQEIARAILYLASDAASFVTGAILAVDGGQTAQV